MEDTESSESSEKVLSESDTRELEAVAPDSDTRPHEAILPDDDTRRVTIATAVVGRGVLDYAAIGIAVACLWMAWTPVDEAPTLPELTPAETGSHVELDEGFEWSFSKGSVRCLAWNSLSSLIAVGGSLGDIEVWNTTERKRVARFHSNGEVLALTFGHRLNDDDESVPFLYSVQGSYRFRGYVDCRLVLWDLTSKKLTQQLSIPLVEIQAVRFSDDSKSLAIASPNQLNHCDLEAVRASSSPVEYNYPSSVAVGGDETADILIGEMTGSVLMYGGDQEIAQRKSFYSAQTNTIVALASSGRVAAVGFSSAAKDESSQSRSVRLWRDWQMWDDVTALEHSAGSIEQLEFIQMKELAGLAVSYRSAANRLIRQYSLLIWELSTGDLVTNRELPSDFLVFRMSPDGVNFASAHSSGVIRIQKR